MVQPSSTESLRSSSAPFTAAVSAQTAVSLAIIRDFVWLLYAIANGQLQVWQLWARLLDRPRDSDAAVVVDDKASEAVQSPPPPPPSELVEVMDPKEASEAASLPVSNDIQSRRGSAVRCLCRAIASKDFDRVYKILKTSSSFASLKHPLGWRPLHVAIVSGDVDLVKAMLDLPDVRIAVTDEWYASTTKSESLVRRTEFHEHLVNIDTRGATTLHFACLAGKWEVIKLLLDAGASFEDTDSQSRKPSEYFDLETVEDEVVVSYEAAYDDWKRVQEKFEPRIEKLCRAVVKQDYVGLKQVLDQSTTSLTSRTRGGWTLIHQAAIKDDIKMLELLLSYHKEDCSDWVNMNDQWYYNGGDRSKFAPNTTPHRKIKSAYALHYACLLGNVKMMEILLKAGADWEYTDYDSHLPESYITDEAGETLKEYNRLVQEAKDRKAGKKPKDGDAKSSSENSKDDGEAKSIEESIGSTIIGQKGPVRSVASAIRLREHGWVDPNRPLVMMFLGSSGVGKTEVAKQVALYLANKDAVASGAEPPTITEVEAAHGFIRVDMSEYQQSHTVSNLFGPPKGYVGYCEGGFLTGKLKKNSKAIVLLDEIEKAHPDVLTVFLQVFDDGRITDSKDGTILCQDAVFIMTSNLASDEIRVAAPRLRQLVDSTVDRSEEYTRVVTQFNREIHPVLKARLKRDEFLGRINQIVVFLPLNEEEISIVINNQLRSWKKRAEESHSIRLTWSPLVVNKLVGAYDTHYGARSVIHEVHRVAVQLVADAQIQGRLKKGWLAHLFINDEGDIDLVGMDSKEMVPQHRGCRYDVF